MGTRFPRAASRLRMAGAAVIGVIVWGGLSGARAIDAVRVPLFASAVLTHPDVLPESCDTTFAVPTNFCSSQAPDFDCPSCPSFNYCTTSCTSVTSYDANQTSPVARRAIRASCYQLGSTRQIRRCDMSSPCNCSEGTLLDDDAPCDLFTPANIGGGC